MKKIVILFPLAAFSLVACVKNQNQETKNNRLIWAERVQATIPLLRPGEYDVELAPVSEKDWNSLFKYDKQKIFTSIKNAVLSGKLKAYNTAYTASKDNPVALTPQEFENILVSYDTVEVSDSENPNITSTAVVHIELTKDMISSLKFYETMELDTVSYTFVKHVSAVSFFAQARDMVVNGEGSQKGEVEIFYVKFNDSPH